MPLDGPHSYHNDTIATSSGHIDHAAQPDGLVTLNNGHVTHGNGHVVHNNFGVHQGRSRHVARGNRHVVHQGAHTNNIVVEDDYMTTGNILPQENVYYANRMSRGEHHTDGVSHARLRSQEHELPSGSRGTIQRTPSMNQPSTSLSAQKVPRGEDGAPDLTCRPKIRAKSNYYEELPMKSLKDNNSLHLNNK